MIDVWWLFISFNNFSAKIFFYVILEWLHLLLFVCIEYLFPYFHFQLVCILVGKECFLQATNGWVLFAHPLSQSASWIEFRLFAFRVIIENDLNLPFSHVFMSLSLYYKLFEKIFFVCFVYFVSCSVSCTSRIFSTVVFPRRNSLFLHSKCWWKWPLLALKILFVYLRGCKDIEGSPIYWLKSQMPATTRSHTGQSQKLGAYPTFLTWVTEIQLLEPSLAASYSACTSIESWNWGQT